MFLRTWGALMTQRGRHLSKTAELGSYRQLGSYRTFASSPKREGQCILKLIIISQFAKKSVGMTIVVLYGKGIFFCRVLSLVGTDLALLGILLIGHHSTSQHKNYKLERDFRNNVNIRVQEELLTDSRMAQELYAATTLSLHVLAIRHGFTLYMR
ncbi:hypothetical protein B0O99DRAFT_638060 [Bisporella sp. PMI_857]|nr:hypothetical protein B0O99DRAFT_638060 [Bisporella sp. PMI_857]